MALEVEGLGEATGRHAGTDNRKTDHAEEGVGAAVAVLNDMKIKELIGKRLVGHYDIDERDELSPCYTIVSIESINGLFIVRGPIRGCRVAFSEDDFMALKESGKCRINTHDYWIEDEPPRTRF